jgi:hypothetical protein
MRGLQAGLGRAPILALLACLACAMAPALAQGAQPSLLRQFCTTTSASEAGAGQCNNPRGIGTDAASGDVYVADTRHNRIERFTAWGDFLQAWGWDVVASGPGDNPAQNEIQQLTVDATGGEFSLQFSDMVFIGNYVFGPISATATAEEVEEALEDPGGFPPLFGPGDLKVSGGPGNAGGTSPYTIEFTGNFANTDLPAFKVINSTLSGGAVSAQAITVQNGGSFEVCIPAEGDVCKAGQDSSSPGGLIGPTGVAVDSGGSVYVVDTSNRRIEKFSPDGEFLLAFGGEVNRTKVEEVGSTEAERNLCPIDPGDICQAGVQGSGKGQFGKWGEVGSFIAIDRNGTAITADDVTYVGDEGRVQGFDSQGHYIEDLPDPDEVLEEGGTVSSLAIDPSSGELYLAFFINPSAPSDSKPNVHKLAVTGDETCTIEAHNPRAIAVGPEGEVYVVQGSSPREVVRFDSSCGSEEALFPPETSSTEEEDQFTTDPTAIAASWACGIEGVDLLFANPDPDNSFIRTYGPPPQDFEPPCRPPLAIPPSIDDRFASSVGTDSATVKAKINPHFWPDTTYQVQFGTEACLEGGWEAACVKEQPAAPVLLSEQVIDAELTTKGVFLGGTEALTPDTTYLYRFVAESSGGGPVSGEEGAFHTFPLPSQPKEGCSNQAFRTGPSARLPDCRAYELVSPLDKANGDLSPPHSEVIDQASPDGEALTYGTFFQAFAEPEAAPFLNQYISKRDPGSGWSTRSINAPRDSVSLVQHETLFTRFKLFSEDLCNGWLLQDTDVPLVEGAVPRGVVNVYRRHGLHAGCGPDGYELLSTKFPPGYDPEIEKSQSAYYPQTQGFSADGELSFFRAAAALSEGACEATEQTKQIFQIYLSQDGTPGVAPKLVSILPGGEAACTHSSVGTSQALGVNFYSGQDSLFGAVSEDGLRVFWTATKGEGKFGAGQEPGKLFLRLNPAEPQSDFLHGSASGTGNLAAGSNEVKALTAAEGEGTLTAGSNQVTGLKTTIGKFVVGQPIDPKGGKIGAGTTITEVTATTLTLSKAAIGSGLFDELHSDGPMPFEVDQTISGPGIPVGTTIVAVQAGKLTLSANATQKQTAAVLRATSACTEPAKACTLPVSEEAEALPGTGPSRFLSGAADGSAAIFSSGGSLFEFDVAKALAGEAATTLIAKQVKGIMGASADASRVYLVSDEELEGEGEAGEPNLYLHERGVGASFIATLGDDAIPSEFVPSSIARWSAVRTSRVSPDGLHAAFTSADPALAQSVVGYGNADVASGRPDIEAYLYDATADGGAGELICVSCNPSGARPTGRLVATLTDDPDDDIWAAARIPAWSSAVHPGNILSSDGKRLFFESFEALVPRDTNGLGDVYEWEQAASKEECLEGIGGELFLASSGGCLSLITSGQGSADSELVDASADGRDVFFLTNSDLLPQDTDFQDIYDAREGGGFPPPPTTPPPCEGDACQNPASPSDEPTPGSSATQQSGNLPPPPRPKPRCAKNKRRVVRNGKVRCVPKHKRSNRRRTAK